MSYTRFIVFFCRFIMVLLSALFYTTFAYTDDIPELVTDRPDQTESSDVVPPKYVQIESGITYSRIKDFDVTEVFGTLVRIGLVNKLELRVGVEGWIIDDILDSEGFGDSEIGIKYYLWDQEGWLPQSAILAGVCLPTAKSTFEGDRFDPHLQCSCRATSVRWAGSYTLNDYLSAGINLAAAWECEKDEDGDRHMNFVLPYTAALGIAVTNRLGGFIEFFGNAPVDPTGKPANLIDGGLTFLVKDNVQLDIAGGFGMTDAAEDWFVGTGVSYRFPK